MYNDYTTRMFNYSMFDIDNVDNAKIVAFEQKIERDFDMIKDHLPRPMNSILDIGCGMGGIDILMYYNRSIKKIYLIDGDGTEEKRAGFDVHTKAWFNVNDTVKFLRSNISADCIIYDQHRLIKVDLIISLKSWGHHYPVGTYLELAKKVLRPLGKIIMDIRKNREDGRSIMEEAGFRWITNIYETPKCERMVFCHA